MAHIPYSIATLWRTHRAHPQNFDAYDPHFTLSIYPTGAGARGLSEYIKFHRKYLAACEQSGLVKPKKILHTHIGTNSVVEEALFEIVLEEGKEDQLAWILPGVRLVNPGASKKACVTFVTIAVFDDGTGKLKEKRIYWDQGSVLRQLGLVQSAGNPAVYGFHSEYSLPIIGHDHEKLVAPDAPLNAFATRIEVCTVTQTSSTDGISSVLSGGEAPPAPHKPAVRLNREASDANKGSHIFEPAELPKNAFSGVKVNPKKFETNAAIFGEESTPASRSSRSSAPGSPQADGSEKSWAKSPGLVENAPACSLYDPVTGAAPIPHVYDPQHHSTNLEFSGPKKSSGNLERPARKTITKHLETTLDKEGAFKEEKVGRPNPSMQSHFVNNEFASPVDDDPNRRNSRSPSPSKIPPHLASSLEGPEPSVRKVYQPHNESHIGQADAEVQWKPKHKPNPQLESNIDKDDGGTRTPVRQMRSSMETTLDKPLEQSNARPKKDMESHVFDADQPLQPRAGINPHKLKSNIMLQDAPPDPAAGLGAPKSPAKTPKSHLKSSVFDEASSSTAPASPTKRTYAEHFVTKSKVEFGDDGGTTGLSPDIPKWVASDGSRPTSANVRRNPGGVSSLQLG